MSEATVVRAPGVAGVPASVAAFAIERPEQEVTASDRFSFSLFLVAALHVAVVLGIGFTMPDPPEAIRSIEVTLAQFRSELTDEDADFLAQNDQQGSGSLDEVRELTTNRDAMLNDPMVNDTAEPLPLPSSVEPPSEAELAPRELADDSAVADTDLAPLSEDQNLDTAAILEQARNLASLDARRSSEIQVDAQGRRIRRLSSVSTRSAVEAAYLNSWRRKIETIGNLNYPQEARRRGLEGDLQVLVEIDANGTLLDVNIMETSGNDILDAAAVRIVRLAAPFQPFPDDLRMETDILHIVRTWQFRRRGFETE